MYIKLAKNVVCGTAIHTKPPGPKEVPGDEDDITEDDDGT